MTRQEQTEFIEELVESVKSTLLEKLPKTPEEWDGHELRRWIADKFNEANYGQCGEAPHSNARNKSRIRAYENEVIVRNL